MALQLEDHKEFVPHVCPSGAAAAEGEACFDGCTGVAAGGRDTEGRTSVASIQAIQPHSVKCFPTTSRACTQPGFPVNSVFTRCGLLLDERVWDVKNCIRETLCSQSPSLGEK